MSEATADVRRPLIPQPQTTTEDLRAALAQITPTRVAAFDAERTAAAEAARSQGDAAPIRRFCGSGRSRCRSSASPHAPRT